MLFEFIVNIVILVFLVYESFFDIKKKTVSLISVLFFCLVALAFMAFEIRLYTSTEIPWIVMQRMGVGLSVLAFGKITRGAIGAGDGLILIAIGSMAGTMKCVMTLMISGIFVFAVAASLLLAGKINRKSRLPFVPFLTLGWVIAMLFG